MTKIDIGIRLPPKSSRIWDSLYLGYMMSKTEAYISHLEMVAYAAEGLGAYADAFIEHVGDEASLSNALVESERLLGKAQDSARKTARLFSRQIDHPSDLAILFLANVFNIQKADRVADLVRRVANYHRGLPYSPGV